MPALEQALGEWRRWGLRERPHVLGRLHGGETNRLYLLGEDAMEEGGQQPRWVLRLHPPESVRLGVDRERERGILNALEGLEIGPHMRYLCPSHRYSLLDYLPGRRARPEDFLNPEFLRRCRALIKRYSALPVDLPPLDYRAYLRRYWQVYARLHPAQARAKSVEFRSFLTRLGQYQKHRPPAQLTHHDLHPGNLLVNGREIRILDWEYAALGYGELDRLALRVAHPFAAAREAKRGDMHRQLRQWLESLWWYQRS